MKATRTILASITLAVGLTAVALPAAAAPPALPDGDRLVNASCDGSAVTLYGVDSATGVATAVGPETADMSCAYNTSWNVVTQTLYGYVYDSSYAELVSFDLATGAATVIGEMVDPDENGIDVFTMAIDLDGEAWAVGGWDGSGFALYDVNLGTGVVTLLGAVAGLDDDAYGFAVDPRTGLLYLLESDGELLLIDPVALTATSVASWNFSDLGIFTYGLAIDNAGTAWVVEYPGDDAYSALWSTPLATFGVDPQLSGNIVDGATGLDYVSWWISVVWGVTPPPPGPALPATGLDATPVAIGGLLLLAAGGVLVARRSRRIT